MVNIKSLGERALSNIDVAVDYLTNISKNVKEKHRTYIRGVADTAIQEIKSAMKSTDNNTGESTTYTKPGLFNLDLPDRSAEDIIYKAEARVTKAIDEITKQIEEYVVYDFSRTDSLLRENSDLNTKLEAAYVKIAQLEAELKVAKGQLELANDEIAKLNAELTDKKKELLDMTAERDKLHLAIYGVGGYTEQITGLETKIVTLESKVTGLEAKIVTLESKVTGLEAKIAQLEAEVNRLKSANANLITNVKEWKRKHDVLKQQLITATANINRLTTDLAAKDVEIKRLSDLINEPLSGYLKQIADLNNKATNDEAAHLIAINALNGQVASLTQRIADLERQKATLEQDKSDLTLQLNTRPVPLNDVPASQPSQVQPIASPQQAPASSPTPIPQAQPIPLDTTLVDNIIKQLDEAKALLSMTDEKLAEEKAKFESGKKALNDKLAETTALLNTTEAKLQQSSADLQSVTQQKQDAAASVTQLQAQLAATNAELLQAQASLRESETKLAEANTLLDTLRAEKQAYELEKQTYELEKQAYELEKQAYELEKQTYIDEINKLKTENAELKATNLNLTTENAELKAENAELKATNSNLMTENKSLMGKIATLESQINTLTREKEDCNAKLNELNSNNGNLKSRILTLEDQIRTLNTTHNESTRRTEDDHKTYVNNLKEQNKTAVNRLKAEIAELEDKNKALSSIPSSSSIPSVSSATSSSLPASSVVSNVASSVTPEEISKLEKKHAEELDQVRKECQKATAQALQKNINDSTRYEQEKQRLIDSYDVKIETLTKDHNDVISRVKSPTKVNETAIQAKQAKIQTLEADCSTAIDEVQTRSDRAMYIARKDFENRLAAITEEKNKLIAKLTEERDRLQSTLDKKTDKIEELTDEKVELIKLKNELFSDWSKLNDNIEQAAKYVNDADRRLAVAERSKTELRNACILLIDQIESKYNTEDSHVKGLESDIAIIQNEIKNAQDTIESKNPEDAYLVGLSEALIETHLEKLAVKQKELARYKDKLYEEKRSTIDKLNALRDELGISRNDVNVTVVGSSESSYRPYKTGMGKYTTHGGANWNKPTYTLLGAAGGFMWLGLGGLVIFLLVMIIVYLSSKIYTEQISRNIHECSDTFGVAAGQI